MHQLTPRKGGLALAVCVLLSTFALPPLAAGDDGRGFDHVFVIMMENTGYDWTGNSAIFIVWDESDFTGSGPFGFGDTSGCCNANPGGGHVLGLVISNALRFALSSDNAFNHYSLLETMEDSWGLGCLGNTCDHGHVKPMSDLARGH